MKNINNEDPSSYANLQGRPRFFCDWISPEDMNGKHILNIGCGFGWFELFAIHHRKIEKIFGIEPTEEDISTAKRTVNYEKVKFLVASALRLPFENDSIDTCVSSDVIEHLPRNSERQFMREVFRVLKPGGKFYITTPAHNLISTLTDPAWYLVGHRHYSQDWLVKLGQSEGFFIKEAFCKGAWWDLIALWNLYISKWIFRRRPFLENIISDKLLAEYNSKYGFMTLCCLFKKPSLVTQPRCVDAKKILT